ncbi:MAG: sulfide/dihydroorotate dehydrogenase-like FAD/NAD-binding protein [Actinomycetota bacterium]|nr:sulfide/dihydroorotate dehydrogenase-like FAD/NAD-binding protein [Actinomycetota bacterium]
MTDNFEVVEKEKLAWDVFRMVVKAPLVTHLAKPGQFVILRVSEVGERIPLTLVDFSEEESTIELLFQAVGTTTDKLATLSPGDSLMDVVGPLGKPTEIEKFGRVCVVGGGVGTGAVFPIARAMSEAGNETHVILGARDAEHLVLLEKFRRLEVGLELATEDGSIGTKGLVTDILKPMLGGSGIDRVVAVGPVGMMKGVSDLTRDFGVKTIVSLNAIMLDGTGMCGTCRCEVKGKTVFSCVDGPEFDGHEVNFDLLIKRLSFYKEEEMLSRERFRKLSSND